MDEESQIEVDFTTGNKDYTAFHPNYINAFNTRVNLLVIFLLFELKSIVQLQMAVGYTALWWEQLVTLSETEIQIWKHFVVFQVYVCTE